MGWPRVWGEILGKHAEEHVFWGDGLTVKGVLALRRNLFLPPRVTNGHDALRRSICPRRAAKKREDHVE